ncbi:MAG: hypothetical protein QMB51_02135 [Patescibacteria group bacterium]
MSNAGNVATLCSSTPVGIKERIKATVVASTLHSMVGWGKNASILSDLEKKIVSGKGGYITEDSVNNLIDLTVDLSYQADNAIQKNQLQRFENYLNSLLITD